MLLASPEFTDHDAKHMSRAMLLAKKGRYSTTPNPHVGCVIVDTSGEIVGEGFHQKAGQAHAEVNALKQAGSRAKNATVYVTLEPCAHYGRTGPCALALIEAGVSRVNIACADSNPEVAGKGITLLVDAGITVALGLLKNEALALNRCFFYRLAHKRPYVTVKLAASLDGRTALKNGESKWITSQQARLDVQKFRAGACAILSGADTVIADNPQLNVRPDELSNELCEQFLWRQQQPLRVVIDSQNRLHKAYNIFTDGHPTLVFNLSHNVNIDKQDTGVQKTAIKQKQLPQSKESQKSHVDLHAVLRDLGDKGINHLWVEAGATLTGALFDAGLVDELVLYQAPKLLGPSSRALSNITEPEVLAKAISGRVVETIKVGDDIRSTIEFAQ